MEKKGVIDDIKLIINVFVFLSLPADGAEVQHAIPTRLNILCLASENRSGQLHQEQHTLCYCPCPCQVTLKDLVSPEKDSWAWLES